MSLWGNKSPRGFLTFGNMEKKEFPTDVSDPRNPRLQLTIDRTKENANVLVFMHMGWDEGEDPNAPRIKCVGCES